MTLLASSTLLGSDARAWIAGAGPAIRVSSRLDSISATASAATFDDTDLEGTITKTKAHSIDSTIELSGRFAGDADSNELYHLLGDINNHPTVLALGIAGEAVGLRMRVYQAIGTGFNVTSAREAEQTFTISGQQAGDYIEGVLYPANEHSGFAVGDNILTEQLSADQIEDITLTTRTTNSSWQDYSFRNTGALRHPSGTKNVLFLRVLQSQSLPTHHNPSILINRLRPTHTTKELVVTDDSGVSTEPIRLSPSLTNGEWVAEVNAGLLAAGITEITASQPINDAENVRLQGSSQDDHFTLSGTWAEFYAVDDTFTAGVSYLDIATRAPTGSSRTTVARFYINPGTLSTDRLLIVVADGNIRGFSARIIIPTLVTGDPTPNTLIRTSAALLRST